MAAKTEYVFFRMAAPVTSGPISGESVVPQHRQSPTPAITVDATTEASGGGTEEMGRAVTCHQVLQKRSLIGGASSRVREPGAQYDDYFERQDLGQIIYFGIDSMDPAVKSQIEALRDSGKIVHLYGTLFSNVPDYNGSQIQVDRIEVEEQDCRRLHATRYHRRDS